MTDLDERRTREICVYGGTDTDEERRIVACVNVCRGIPTELLERSVLEQVCLNRWMINALPAPVKDPA